MNYPEIKAMPITFKDSFNIDNRKIGGQAPCLIIAEAGVSHFGDIGLARELVDLAAESGADIFKTQFFDVEALISQRALDWRDRLRPRNLTLDQAHELKERCDKHGLLFAATAHDVTRISWLEELNVPVIKVGSGERNNPKFLTRLANLGRPMIVSTGMHTEKDVHETLKACAIGGCTEVALLHCVTSYPTPENQVNLAAMSTLKTVFPGPVGYSDHTEDGLAVLAAVARGAKVIEKHITILRDVPNAQDWKVSAGPENFAQLITDIRRIEQMIGHGRKETAPCEESSISWALKSLVASHYLPRGHVICERDLCAKRPGDGIQPNRINEVLGRRLIQPIIADEALSFEMLE